MFCVVDERRDFAVVSFQISPAMSSLAPRPTTPPRSPTGTPRLDRNIGDDDHAATYEKLSSECDSEEQ